MPRSFQNGGQDFNEPAIYLRQRYIPNNVTLKKRTVCILRPVPAFGWAPVITRLLVQQSELAQFSLSCSILILLHFIRMHFTYFKGDNIGAKCVQMKTEAFDYSEKGTKSTKGLRLTWCRKYRPRCLHELAVKIEQLIVILLLNFRVEIFQLEAKWKFVETLKVWVKNWWINNNNNNYNTFIRLVLNYMHERENIYRDIYLFALNTRSWSWKNHKIFWPVLQNLKF